MTIGNQATEASINQSLTALSTELRNSCQAIVWFYQFVSGLGLSGLEALGFSATDAAAVLTNAGYMNAVAAVFEGTGTQQTASNYQAALAPLSAGG